MIKRKQFNMRISPTTMDQIRWAAEFQGVTMTQIIEDALKLYFLKWEDSRRVADDKPEDFDGI
tara:strand:- start:116 stop:304 length:189 start_codon:yes stop_codon:yes gene_type:complete